MMDEQVCTVNHYFGYCLHCLKEIVSFRNGWILCPTCTSMVFCTKIRTSTAEVFPPAPESQE